jgi:type IV pilus assembly protein PilO
MQINLKNPNTQKMIIGVTLAFGMIYGYINFVYTPRNDKAIKLAADIKKETELLTKGKRIAANFQTVQDDYGRLMQSWEIARELLPTQREMEGLLKNITMEGQDQNIDFLLFKPLDPVEKPYYWENPIQIKTLSKYHDLGEFLSSVASMERIVNVNDLKLTAYKPTRGRSPQTVQAEFTASIYIFKDLGTPTTTQADEAVKDKKGAAAAPGAPGNQSKAAAPKPSASAKEKGEKA